MGKAKAPDPPDYAAAAKEQGAANLNSAIGSNVMNQINQVGPTGSLTYAYNNYYTLPDGTKIPVATATTQLSPEQQNIYNQNTKISTDLNKLAIEGIDYVGDAVSNPITAQTVGGPSIARGLARTTFDPTADPTAQAVQGQYDFSQVGAMPDSADFGAERDRITNAYMERLQPYLTKQREALDTKLANQGITHGSEAYNWDQDILNRGENDQRIAALLAGDQEAARLFQQKMGIRQQGVGEAVSRGNFANQAQQQMYGQNLQDLINKNQAASSNFAQGLASAQFQNAARQQAIQEADYFQNQPLNMLNALRSGNQVQMPQFGNVSNGAQIAPPPIYAAASDQYAAAMQNYQAKLQQQSALMGGIAGLGSAAIMASDRKLKRDIQHIFTRLDGLKVYSYRYVLGALRYIGVMADEVAIHRPEALGPVRFGFATVNYGKL